MSDCTKQHGLVVFKKILSLMTNRVLPKIIRFLKKLLAGLIVIFSPLIVWIILCLNRELIVVLANWEWLSNAYPSIIDTLGEHVNTTEFARGFNEAALGGLLTLFGVIVTVWYYQVIRVQEVTEKRLFVIDEILEELKRNRNIVNDIIDGNIEKYALNNTTKEETIFITESWHKLGGDVALLPRRLHLRLSVLYGCLNRCSDAETYWKSKATIDRISGIITDLHKYRSSLSRPDIS